MAQSKEAQIWLLVGDDNMAISDPNPMVTPTLPILLSKSGTITLDQIEHLHFK